jgi:hypothetical protein
VTVIRSGIESVSTLAIDPDGSTLSITGGGDGLEPVD